MNVRNEKVEIYRDVLLDEFGDIDFDSTKDLNTTPIVVVPPPESKPNPSKLLPTSENGFPTKFEGYAHKLYPFEALVQRGYVSKSEYRGLVLYKYTDKCTFEKAWTLFSSKCRGTVYEKATGRLIAKTFDKFFNNTELKKADIPNLPYRVTKKLDGSCGNIFYYDGAWRASTLGSFFSVQSMRAEELLRSFEMDKIPKNISLTVEIIYPENRIILNYGDFEDLVVLAAFDNTTGNELDWEQTKKIANDAGFCMVEEVKKDLNELQHLANTMDPVEEGWVIQYDNGFRMKVKLDSYLRLAKFKANLSPLAVWEAMKENKLKEFLTHCPEEFETETKRIVNTLQGQVGTLNAYATIMIQELGLITTTDKNAINDQAKTIIFEAPAWMRRYLFAYVRKGTEPNCIACIRPTSNTYTNLDQFRSGLE